MLDRLGDHINSSPDRTWELLDVAVSDDIAEGTDPRAGDALLGIEAKLRVSASPSAVRFIGPPLAMGAAALRRCRIGECSASQHVRTCC